MNPTEALQVLVGIADRGGVVRARDGRISFDIPGGIREYELTHLGENKALLLKMLSVEVFVRTSRGTYRTVNPPTVDEVLAACRAEGWNMGPDKRSEAA